MAGAENGGEVIVAGMYSFNRGLEVVRERYPERLTEVEEIIAAIDASRYKTKPSSEERKKGRLLYSPPLLNTAFKKLFTDRGWVKHRVECDYPVTYYTPDYKPKTLRKGAYREMDFVKDKLGIELQLGKYSFMVYNVCAKMTIFKNFGVIDTGIEIVPIKQLADDMSSGVSYFEQFVWDLEARGVADIDIPVLILGIDA